MCILWEIEQEKIQRSSSHQTSSSERTSDIQRSLLSSKCILVLFTYLQYMIKQNKVLFLVCRSLFDEIFQIFKKKVDSNYIMHGDDGFVVHTYTRMNGQWALSLTRSVFNKLTIRKISFRKQISKFSRSLNGNQELQRQTYTKKRSTVQFQHRKVSLSDMLSGIRKKRHDAGTLSLRMWSSATIPVSLLFFEKQKGGEHLSAHQMSSSK